MALITTASVECSSIVQQTRSTHFSRPTATAENRVFGRGVRKKGLVECTLSAWTEVLCKDLRYASRMLRMNPGVTVVAILSLSLGVAVNTTIFSAFDALLLRPLPYQNIEQVVAIDNVPLKQQRGGAGASVGDLVHWRERNRSFEQIEVASGWEVTTLTGQGQGDPERVRREFMTPRMFQLLRVLPVLGSGFDSEADYHGNEMMISYELWLRRFGGDRAIIGRTIFTDDSPNIIMGVLPRGFDLWGQGPMDLYHAIPLFEPNFTDPNMRWLLAIGRLKRGVTIERAQSQMDVVARQLAQAYPETNKEMGLRLEPLQKALFGWSRTWLNPLFAAVGFVLLIACSNVANLLLSRAAIRQKEVAIRAALGAGRLRLIRQLLTESILLGLLSGIVGLALSFWGIRLFLVLTPQEIPQIRNMSIDMRVLAFTLGISVLTGILFGLAPALRASRTDLVESLKEGVRSFSRPSRQRGQSVLVVAEMALAYVLLVCAGLMINTFVRELRVNPGFDSTNLVTVELRAGGLRYIDPTVSPRIRVTPALPAYFKEVENRMKRLSGVESAALVDWLPMQDESEQSMRPIAIAGKPAAMGGQRPGALYQSISPDYFHAMRIPLLKGRGISEADIETSPWVVVINDAMARKFWPNQDPIGQLITIETQGARERPREVVGIAGNVRQFRLADEPRPEMYVSHQQQADIFVRGLLAIPRSQERCSADAASAGDVRRDSSPHGAQCR
jgi:putative ABC transport system permease protein